MTPTPEQIAELTHRLKHETWSGFQNLAVQASTAITEQAAEIAELRAKLEHLKQVVIHDRIEWEDFPPTSQFAFADLLKD
jgi:uncharacterized coiled-coil protein SlyX